MFTYNLPFPPFCLYEGGLALGDSDSQSACSRLVKMRRVENRLFTVSLESLQPTSLDLCHAHSLQILFSAFPSPSCLSVPCSLYICHPSSLPLSLSSIHPSTSPLHLLPSFLPRYLYTRHCPALSLSLPSFLPCPSLIPSPFFPREHYTCSQTASTM